MGLRSEFSVGIVFKNAPASGHKVDSTTAAATRRGAALSEALIERSIRALEKRGFRVTGRSPYTLSIRGTPQLVEHTFSVELKHRLLATSDSTSGDAMVVPAEGYALTIPEELRDVIAVAQIQPPNRYLAGGSASPAASGGGGAVQALPPSVSSYHLEVLSDVPHLLKADKVHAKGTTGAGVRVAMVDSGFDHQHPFFVGNGFTSKRVLADALSGYSTDIDARGHGTGESANLFSIAPGVEFIGIKIGGDAPGDPEASILEGFQTALGLRPLPSIISCSVMLQSKPWDALAQAIIDAHDQSITVVVCAGNGDYAFPAQMPEVIAAGGVYVAANGRKRASNYSSAFVSTDYPGRSVPDCCGLVGQLPRAAYIMLPVPPGSSYDLNWAQPDGNGNPGDGTGTSDGWALFSGTSATAPQLAGVCALLLEKNPSLTPTKLKAILMTSSVAVSSGSSNPNTGGFKASSKHPNTATGTGLVNAYTAWQSA